MKSQSVISLRFLSVSAVTVCTALMVLGGLASLSSAASGGPTVVLSSTSATTTSATSIPVTATFSEPVSGLDSTHVTATNATVGNVSGSGTTFNFTLTPTASGTVTVMIGADMSTSVASSTGNQQSDTLTFMYAPDSSSSTSTATTTPTGPAFLALSNYSGPPGTSINALGTNFAASETVAVGFGSATTTATADASGDFTLPLTVPALSVGPAAITAMGQSSGLIATNSFYVQEGTGTTTPPTSTSTPLALTGIDTVQGNATADGNFADGWQWVLHLTVPDSETHFAMKFADFTSGTVSSTIPAMNNIRIYSPQSSNASSVGTAMTETGNGYSADMMLTGDTSTTTAGRQIDVFVQVAVPSGTLAGSYSTTFGALSTTTPF